MSIRAVPRVTQQGVLTVVEGGARFEDGEIQMAQGLADETEGRDPILFKGVFDRNFLRNLRIKIAEYPYRYSDYSDNGHGLPANFHRRDVFPPWTKPTGTPYKCCMQYFFFFPWNENPPGVDRVATAVARFRNKLVGEAPDTALQPGAEEAFFGTFTHYPIGGGFCEVHHWYKPGNVPGVPRFNENLVLFTRYGEDYRSGGLYLWKDNELWKNTEPGRVHAEPLFDPGDVLCLTSTVGHEILPVDSECDRDWDPLRGRFLMWVGKNPISGLRGFASTSAQASRA